MRRIDPAMFLALDFETANSQRSSACALGIARIQEGKLVERRSWLIRPAELYFDPFNTYIHGISAEDVRDQPEFDQIWSELLPYLQSQLVLAHNASFDFSVLRHVLDQYNIEYPELDYLCTVTLARKSWPDLARYKLNIVAEHLDIPLQHHDAEEDAVAAALIAHKACQLAQVDSPLELARLYGIKPGRLYPGGYEAAGARSRAGTQSFSRSAQ